MRHAFPMPPRALEEVRRVAAEHDVCLKDVLGRSRFKIHDVARAEAYARMLEIFDRRPSLPTIGGWFDRDHTAILSGIRKAHARRAEARG